MTRAVAHYKRTGCILPGTQGEVARYLRRQGDG